MSIFLGPWFAAWSFPVLTCWLAGSLSGSIVSAGKPSSRVVLGFAVRLVVVSVCCGVVAVTMRDLGLRVRGTEVMQVDFLEWKRTQSDLSLSRAFLAEGEWREELTPDEMAVLRRQMSGQLTYRTGDRSLRVKKAAHAVVILQDGYLLDSGILK